VYRPFQLDPSAPSTPSPVFETYAKKFGSVERAHEIVNHVTEVAATEGLTFRMDIAQRANTLTAHRLLWFAHTKGVQAEMKERLLRAYFRDGADINNHKVLIRLAIDLGLDETEVATMLSSDQGVNEVTRELAEAASRGITAVPTFVFNGEFMVSGAQEAERLVAMLTKLLAAEHS
jgi:predicted DsbA family dithiol-disulfide isomerase